MRIRLTETLPLDPKHGAIEGAEFDVVRVGGKTGRYFMVGHAGEEFAAFKQELEVVNAEPAAPVEDDQKPAPNEKPAASVPEYSDEEKLEAANEAIGYFLERMRDHEQLLYHMNHTKGLELLCDAYAKLNGVSAERADNYFTGRTEEL